MQKRNFGLDVLRAAAILLVLFNHVLNYFITFNRSTILGDIGGILGVELFFVLSGFLIGRILLTDWKTTLPQGFLKRFYLRRWFRTLPLYYFLLIIFVASAYAATRQPDFHLLHFIFLQNVIPESLRFFSVSWSLAIEEWFYLLLPLLLLAGDKTRLFTRKTIRFLLILIIGIISIKLAYVLLFEPIFDDMRKHIFFRFDSLFIGVLLASVKLHMHGVYKAIQKPYVALFALCCIGLLAYGYAKLYTSDALDTSLTVRVFALPVLSLAIALVLPFLEINYFINTVLTKIIPLRWIVTWISLLSYSIYLIHLIIFDAVRGTLQQQFQPVSLMLIALVLTFFLSYLLYRYIEKPFMDARRKFS